MGYVHWFKQHKTVTPAQWRRFQDELTSVFDRLPPYSLSSRGEYKEEPIRIADGFGQQRYTHGDDLFVDAAASPGRGQALIFNGLMSTDMDHDGFHLTRLASDQTKAFCTTARKPYDFLVIASLILINERAPGAFEIESDGDLMDWSPVGSWLARALHRDIRLPPKITGSDVLKHGCFSYILEGAKPSYYDGIEVARRSHIETGVIIESTRVEDCWF